MFVLQWLVCTSCYYSFVYSSFLLSVKVYVIVSLVHLLMFESLCLAVVYALYVLWHVWNTSGGGEKGIIDNFMI